MPSVPPGDTVCKFPTEILSHIFNYVPNGEFAPLARSSRLFYQLCNPLLYRDLYIHTPKQLARLSGGENLTYLVKDTEAMFLDDWALCLERWDGIEAPFVGARPFGCLINIFKATPFLRWLQVCQSNLVDPEIASDGLRQDLGNTDTEQPNLTLDPSFLPRLAFVITYRRGRSSDWIHGASRLVALIRGRSVGYRSSSNDTKMLLRINHRLLADSLGGNSRPGLEGFGQNTSSSTVAELIKSSLQVSYQSRISPQLIMVRINNCSNPSSARDTYLWLGNLMAKLRPVVTLPLLNRLIFQFDDLAIPDGLFRLARQNSFFELIDQNSPELVIVVLKFYGSAIWVRWFKLLLTPEEKQAHPNLPRWVPGFVTSLKNEIYGWWIESLNLDAGILRRQNHDALQSIAFELNQAFQLAYRDSAPDQGRIARDLLEYSERG